METRARQRIQLDCSESRRILFAAIGSLGDLHPCIALGLELRRRGHQVTVASTEAYRRKVEAHKLSFRSLRPNWDPTDQDLIRQCEDLRSGPEVLYRKLILPHLRDTYEDLLPACREADLMIAGELVYAAPLVAEKVGLPWISSILSPSSFFSSYDPSVLVTVPSLIRLRKAGQLVYRAGLNVCRLATRHWSNPVRRLRRELGLQAECDPVFRDKFSPHLVLALFSKLLAQPQPDWPLQTIQPGFVYYDNDGHSPELTEFLASGEPPIVFTLGSTAVHHPGDFYEASMKAAQQLGRRGVLLGANAAPRYPTPEILALPYAPYAQVFPRAGVIVHQGGSGTTGQALRAGRPMLFVPYGWDQPDNAARVERLGIGLSLSRKEYSASSAAAALQRLLAESDFASRAAEVGMQVRQEGGLLVACDAIELVLKEAPGMRTNRMAETLRDSRVES
jgi:UDP:flavonoid glycosyltransferase YjiC (YdhE family)